LFFVLLWYNKDITKKKKIITSIIGSIVLVSALVGAGIYTSVIKLPITTTAQMSPILTFSIDNPKELVANSHNVFVGRVIKQTGTELIAGSLPATLYSVEVISDIKGSTEPVVTVLQIGGYKHGILYVMNVDTVSAGEADEKTAKGHLLQPGSTYVFVGVSDPSFGPIKNKVGIYASFYGSALITSEKGLSIAQAKTAAAQNARVQELQKAYDEISGKK